MYMQNAKCSKILTGAGLLVLLIVSFVNAQESGFTNEDRERLIRLETTLQMFMEQTGQRFEQQRQDNNKRFEELRQDSIQSFAQMDKRFEQVDKRFEQVDKRFEQFMSFLWMLVGIFTTLTIATIGFAWWDRRTTIRRAQEETIQVIEKDGSLVRLIQALREVAVDDARVAKALRTCGFL